VKIVIVSTPQSSFEEAKMVNELFEEGLEYFHLNKRKDSLRDYTTYLERIYPHYRNRVIIHQYPHLVKKYDLAGLHIGRSVRKEGFSGWIQHKFHKLIYKNRMLVMSCKRLSTLQKHASKYNYAMLGPVFTIEPSGKATPNFNPKITSNSDEFVDGTVLAGGDLTFEQLPELHKFGFKGVALREIIWRYPSGPVEAYRKVKEIFS
jgi:thiamine-phosphate pyrophosphorylase